MTNSTKIFLMTKLPSSILVPSWSMRLSISRVLFIFRWLRAVLKVNWKNLSVARPARKQHFTETASHASRLMRHSYSQSKLVSIIPTPLILVSPAGRNNIQTIRFSLAKQCPNQTFNLFPSRTLRRDACHGRIFNS